MESRIPLPTDNLYKFVALFSLALLISAFVLIVYATKTTNSIVFEHWVELEILRADPLPTVAQQARKASLERRVEIAAADKRTYMRLAGGIGALGAAGMVLGFLHWHRRIQPIIDQMAATQLELAKLQLLALKAELKAKGIELEETPPVKSRTEDVGPS